ncbi:hypothetical protein SAMN05444339_10422 [Loktanella atrilutea]|uniref:Uncharacterized protein n=1 Tax=Loktanella atrilutea TaxID=366533 RepID=A0A1M4ZKZ2_LOKAT|nr:hypothetical protein [Loktanella atrilutea]SHF18477.1 hypothetical protein SAMN05444339_10422 [Loktanella atrilutea]
MTPEIVRDLHPPRLPADFVALGWSDLLAAFGVGLVLAGLVLIVLQPLLRPRTRPARLNDRIAAAAALPGDRRLLALSALLTERGQPLPDDLRHALYAGTPYDPARAEALLRRPREVAHV